MTDSVLRQLLIHLLDALDSIADAHDEILDTDVRERMAEVIERVLVKGGPIDVGSELGMFSDDGNRRVADALRTFLQAAAPRAAELGLTEGARRGAVWDIEATSTAGETVDVWLGWPNKPLE